MFDTELPRTGPHDEGKSTALLSTPDNVRKSRRARTGEKMEKKVGELGLGKNGEKSRKARTGKKWRKKYEN